MTMSNTIPFEKDGITCPICHVSLAGVKVDPTVKPQLEGGYRFIFCMACASIVAALVEGDRVTGLRKLSQPEKQILRSLPDANVYRTGQEFIESRICPND